MNKFYTSVERYGNSILYRGYEGHRKIKERIKFKPTLFVKSEKGTSEWTELYGSRVEPVKFDSMRDAKEFIDMYKDMDNYPIYGNTRYISQYIQEQFPRDIPFETSTINITAFDIEVFSGDGFPEPKQATRKIQSISLCNNQSDQFYSWGLKDFDTKENQTYFQFNTEIELLTHFINWWSSPVNTPDVLTGWNSETFDIPYLVNRIINILGEEAAHKLSPWKRVSGRTMKTRFGDDALTYEISGIQCLDYLQLFKKFGFTYGPQENYKLDHIAEVVLGEKKVDWSDDYNNLEDLYNRNHQLYIEYNIQDVNLIKRFEEVLHFIELAYIMAFKGGVNATDSLGTTTIWDTLIFRELALQKVTIPPSTKKFKEKYPGAYVKPPTPGFYHWVMAFDLDSLYPLTMSQYNMSPETLIDGQFNSDVTVDGVVNGFVNPLKNTTLTPNGIYFKSVEEQEGVFPKIIKKIFAERKAIKKRMLEARSAYETETDIIAKERLRVLADQLDNEQFSRKLLLNSLYGATGSQYFRYFDLRIAEGITAAGQASNFVAEKAINDFCKRATNTPNKDYVIAMDTDSVVGSSIINVNGDNMTIADYFDSLSLWENESRGVKIGDGITPSLNLSNGNVENNRVVYAMRHKVKKRLFKVTSETGNSVTVTEDHSIMAYNSISDTIVELSPRDLDPKIHKIINIMDTDTGGTDEF